MKICTVGCTEENCNSFECFYDKECVQYKYKGDCGNCKCFCKCSFCKNMDSGIEIVIKPESRSDY